jgi:hypothetical protein
MFSLVFDSKLLKTTLFPGWFLVVSQLNNASRIRQGSYQIDK